MIEVFSRWLVKHDLGTTCYFCFQENRGNNFISGTYLFQRICKDFKRDVPSSLKLCMSSVPFGNQATCLGSSKRSQMAFGSEGPFSLCCGSLKKKHRCLMLSLKQISVLVIGTYVIY